MFSGGDSSDGINSLNHFAAYGFVNQVAVTNAMAAGQNIDWAQLAQQWIQMRDNSVLNVKKDSDVSGSKAGEANSNSLKFEEKGEADMDMDDEELSDDKAVQKNNTDYATSSIANNDFNQTWFFGEDNSHIDAQPSSSNQWNPWPGRENLPNQNHSNNRSSNSTTHIPSLLKINVPRPSEIRVVPDTVNQTNNANVMDAAKRKGLPAWIREGLEKMEREKQKQLEKVQQNKDINISDDDENSSNTSILVKSTSSLRAIPAGILHEESTDNEDEIVKNNAESDIHLKKETGEKYSSSEDKTYDQKLSELMIVVRTTLTELLLETTNEEISKVAEETIKMFKSKASSAQVIRKSALSTLTDKLGLAAYGDSSSENDSDNDESNSSKKTSCQSESDNDSDEEIRNMIRVKRKAFIKTSEEIEDRVALAAAREEEKLKYFLRKEEEEKEYNQGKLERSSVRDPSNSGNSGHIGYEKDFGEITETKIQQPNGKRQKERTSRRERITRFSDNKDKYVALPNAATFLTNLSSSTNFSSGNSTTAPANSSQRPNIPDINGLLPNYKSTGMTNALNAADAALEKALKTKTPTNNENRRHEGGRSYYQSKKRRLSESKCSRSLSKSSSSSTSSSSSSTSSESNSSSTSRSSRHSKHKHRSSKKHKSHTHVERHGKSSQDSRSKRKYQSSSYKKRDRESTSSRHRRNLSSDSEDDYRRRYRSDSNSTRNSSQIRSHTSSRRPHDREHSRSQSRSSYSSNNRRQ